MSVPVLSWLFTAPEERWQPQTTQKSWEQGAKHKSPTAGTPQHPEDLGTGPTTESFFFFFKPSSCAILRANPFPEVTDPFCRLPLPTLSHWLEAVHLGDLLRLLVRVNGAYCNFSPPDFHGPNESLTRQPLLVSRFSGFWTLSLCNIIPGSSTSVCVRGSF